jgi:excisionase family DNA binding protein
MEKLWTTQEVAHYLGIGDADVEQLIREGKLTGYKLGGQFLRFRPSQVETLKGALPVQSSGALAQERISGVEQVRDFLYFYDFYLIAAGLLAVMVAYLIAAG